MENKEENQIGKKPAQGGYKSLPFFKQTEIIYDFTVEFTKKYRR